MFTALFAAFFVSTASASDYAAYGADQAALAGDTHDRGEIAAILGRWNSAVARHDLRDQREADAALMAWLREELAEADREVDKARYELGQASREARGPGRDDDRDRSDDAKDLTRELNYQGRLSGIAGALYALQPAFADGYATPGQLAQKAALLDELRDLAAAELAATYAELAEDRGEAREDRFARF